VTIFRFMAGEASPAHQKNVAFDVTDAPLHALTRRQLSLLTRAQAREILTEDQIEARLRSGHLVIVRPSIYRVGGAAESWEQSQLAACLAGGSASAASFRAAAWLWRLDGFRVPDQLEITVPRARRARLPGVVVHDTRVMGAAHVTTLGGIPVTTPARTLCDLTACCGLGQVARALNDALRRDLTTLTRIQRVFLDLANRGRRRSTFMRALLEERLPGFDPGESEQEAKIVRWLVGAGLPRPAQQHRVEINGRRYRLDLAYPRQLVGIEYDGWDAHRSRTAFDADRERDIELEEAGWLMLHFTSASKRIYVITKVRNALQSRRR